MCMIVLSLSSWHPWYISEKYNVSSVEISWDPLTHHRNRRYARNPTLLENYWIYQTIQNTYPKVQRPGDRGWHWKAHQGTGLVSIKKKEHLTHLQPPFLMSFTIFFLVSNKNLLSPTLPLLDILWYASLHELWKWPLELNVLSSIV